MLLSSLFLLKHMSIRFLMFLYNISHDQYLMIGGVVGILVTYCCQGINWLNIFNFSSKVFVIIICFVMFSRTSNSEAPQRLNGGWIIYVGVGCVM